MKIYILRINGGFNTDLREFYGPETVCFTMKDNKVSLEFVTLENLIANPVHNQLLIFNEEEKNLYNDFLRLGDSEDTFKRTLKTLSAKEWSDFLNQRIGSFIQPKSLELV